MRMNTILAGMLLTGFVVGAVAAEPLPEQAPIELLGLPPVPVPAENPQTPEKIALGDKLFNDERFSSTGDVSCATCHDADKAFTDSPLSVSEGINKLTGTRNAPTVLNAAYNKTQFWDGRSPDLEDQALHPFLNPVEMALPNHDALLAIVREDKEYAKAFKDVFGVTAGKITMTEVTRAIAAFERVQVAGNSAFDRWYFGGKMSAMSPEAQRGLDLFLGDGRCVSCHVIEQDQAVFTDHRFHNIGVGINDMQDRVLDVATAFQRAKLEIPDFDVDIQVLTDANVSELGRFAISDELSDLGAFKTPTLRNIAKTAPYMHDGSIETLRDVVTHYNNGGVTNEGDPVNPFISGGIRPLDLSDEQIDDLVAFMEALTSAEYEDQDLAAAIPRTNSVARNNP
jgi:cytochrome c peroxidase